METEAQLPGYGKLFAALAKAQGEITNPAKTKVNPHFKSRYAPLDEFHNSLHGPLAKNGLSYLQRIENYPDKPLIRAVTIIGHESGQYMEVPGPWLPVGKQDAQGVGSTTTYAKRYALAAAFGLEGEEDDDGNAASAPAQKPKSVPYPADKFEENLPKWLHAGTTAANVKKTLAAKQFTLSQAQQKELEEVLNQEDAA